jgi:uncharacterized protein
VPRPPCCRRVRGRPGAPLFKPAGVPGRQIEQVVLALDEFEALRLADFEGRYHDEAAAAMGVSRPTFGRIVEAARRKVADVLLHGKALRIEGGPIAAGDEASCCCPRRDAEPGTHASCPRCGGIRRDEREEQP